ncbi:MAG: DDE-type integrase/transposase/recombinase [Nanoarchaeota archaeon]|nr:DDE-type integrase/transposase/recombinase [Nanoarchaeota archaeon]
MKGGVHYDEKYVKVSAKDCYDLNAIDSKTKFVLAHLFVEKRTKQKCYEFLKQIKDSCYEQILERFNQEKYKKVGDFIIDKCIPNFVYVNNSCSINDNFVSWSNDTNNCYAKTGSASDLPTQNQTFNSRIFHPHNAVTRIADIVFKFIKLFSAKNTIIHVLPLEFFFQLFYIVFYTIS